MEKGLRLLGILLLLAGSVFAQVESVQVNSSTRNVVNTGTINYATGQLLVNGVTMPPAGGGTPGGSDTQVQFNDGGAFGGDSGLTYDTSTGKVLLSKNQNGNTFLDISNTTSGASAAAQIQLHNDNSTVFAFGINSSGSTATGTWGAGEGGIYLGGSSNPNFVLMAAGGSLEIATQGMTATGFFSNTGWRIGSNEFYGFSSATDPSGTANDTALGRNAAGILEINNGTAGQYRDLKLRTLTYSTIASTMLEADASGNVTGATAGTDYVSPTGTETLTNKRITPRVVAQASGASWSPNADTTDTFTITTAQAAAVTTINNPSGTPVDGQKLMFRVKCDGTNRALSGWGTQYRASTDLAFPTTLTANKTIYMGFAYNSVDTKWDFLAKTDGF